MGNGGFVRHGEDIYRVGGGGGKAETTALVLPKWGKRGP